MMGTVISIAYNQKKKKKKKKKKKINDGSLL